MREDIYQWMKSLAVFYLFFTAVLQLVPDRKYERYVRSFMGVLLIYMLCTPVFAVFGKSGQLLEGFDLEQFEMVGALSSESQASALLRVNGVIHRVKVGDYLGRNNGQVAWIQAQQIEVFELIPDGRGGWLERSLTIPLKQQS